ncbi:hypothetical protein [Mesorhizobium sp. M0006]
MSVIDQKSDEKRFNETVQRMLKTPPKPKQNKPTEEKPKGGKRDELRHA